VRAVAPDAEDDFEKFQKEVAEAEADVEALKGSAGDGDVDQLDDERPATPPDGEEEFTDDDGTIYKWDRTLRAWVPQVSVAHQSLQSLGIYTRFFFWSFRG
jgi:HIV Tat-specific factor 1